MARELVSLTGLDRDSPAFRLYQKAKRLGTWDPAEIDFSTDREQWPALTAAEQDLLLRSCTLFLAGEESVVLDLLPLMGVIAQEGRLEEELYLTSFLWEEGKHTEFFRRFLDDVAGEHGDLTRFYREGYRQLFAEELPTAMSALHTDPSPTAQAKAVVTYTLIVEGVLAETGYHAFFTALEARELLPGLRKGLGLVKRDESRHIAYGIYVLSRLIREDPSIWDVVEARLNELGPLALEVANETFAGYRPIPFDLPILVPYAAQQLQKRRARIESVRLGTSPGELDIE
jgi:ribonucleoside-diphosphate reductase beta chain